MNSNFFQNENEKPLIIRASAGTGKTYRLSLEFINLLLKYRINFEEILVITFTKKATAEIRERIFQQLFEIVSNTSKGIELKQNIQQNINPEIKFNLEEMQFLKAVYQSMITNKSIVNISTIDSFVNTVFSGIIAPYNNITNFQIDNKINSEILPEIFENVLKEENLNNYENIFLHSKRRNLDQFKELILDIIENRWLFEFIDLTDFHDLDIEIEKEKAYNKYKTSVKEFLELLQTGIINSPKPVSLEAYFQTDFKKTILSLINFNEINTDQISISLYDILTNCELLSNNSKLIFDKKKILYLGGKLKSDELKLLYKDLQDSLADFFYYDKALNEQFNIISLAADVLRVYDEVKFRDKVFTHSDISYYTFRFLYDSKLSIIDKGNVLNIFYEQLSYNTRFVLIDEFQDTSILQWSIFYPILKEITSGIGQKEYGRVIVVGDEKQAIYGWRGGERKLLTNFESILNEPVEHNTLSTSYRSKPVLMNWLNKLFKSEYLHFVNDWNYTEIDCDKAVGGFVQVDLRNSVEDDTKLNKADIYREFVQNNLLPNIRDKKIKSTDTAIIMRKNKELEIMAQVLNEFDIDFTLEMSGSLFQHKAIKPILFILKFLVYEDFWELIKFLRSDLVLMNPVDLQSLISEFQSSSSLKEFLQTSKTHPYLSVLYNLKHQSGTLLFFVKTILEEFGFTKIFSSEVELKNLQRFMGVTAEFERSNHEYSSDTSGFLQFCSSLAEKDEYSQIGQSLSDSIKLLTIHKSKGLQFETVYTVFDVSSKIGGNNTGLKLYYSFADNFRSLDDFAFTYNYDRIMQRSQKQKLIDFVNQRSIGDELNNIYVALTRAKNNLFIYLHYNKKGDLEKFIKDIKTDSSVLKNITKAIFNEFKNDLNEISLTSHKLQFGKLSVEPFEQVNNVSSNAKLPDFFAVSNNDNITEMEVPNLYQLSSEFLENQSIQIGNIVHDYLSHIKYDDTKARQIAMENTLAKYGSLFHKDRINEIVIKIDEFIDDHLTYFAGDDWDKVFNEFTVFDDQGKESRIDRLMINTLKKEILIIDYKTGLHYEEEQLDRYKEILDKFPIVIKENYDIKVKYIEINISKTSR